LQVTLLGTSSGLSINYLYFNLLDPIYKLGRYKTMITSNGKSIVVVDDERDIVNQIKRSLGDMDGFKSVHLLIHLLH
jgi:hypothetical protein